MKYIKLFEELINEKMLLPDDVLEISKIFFDNGYEIYVVGGAVRDFVMGKEPKDYDLVTNAQPSSIERILSDKYRLGLQGKHFAVIRVYTKQTPEGIEIASYRKDISKGRDNKFDNKPKVEFGRHITIRDDVFRRDLTMNALYYDINNQKIVDLVGGLNDIKNKIVRSVGNPRERFKEDRLRILRVFRFASKTNSNIDDETSDAIKYDNRLNGISEEDDVSQERINDEFYSMLNWSIKNNNIKSWKKYFNLLKEFKMFDRMYPGVLLNLKYYNTLDDKLIFSLLFNRNKPDKSLYDILKFNFKLTNIVTDSIIFLLRLKDLFNDDNIYKVLDYQNNLDNIVNIFRIKESLELEDDILKDFAKFSNINFKYIIALINYKITTNVKDLIDLGYNGKRLGEELKKLEIEKYKKLL